MDVGSIHVGFRKYNSKHPIVCHYCWNYLLFVFSCYRPALVIVEYSVKSSFYQLAQTDKIFCQPWPVHHIFNVSFSLFCFNDNFVFSKHLNLFIILHLHIILCHVILQALSKYHELFSFSTWVKEAKAHQHFLLLSNYLLESLLDSCSYTNIFLLHVYTFYNQCIVEHYYFSASSISKYGLFFFTVKTILTSRLSYSFSWKFYFLYYSWKIFSQISIWSIF